MAQPLPPNWCGHAAPSTVQIAGEPRFIPVEYAGRYRDALGVPLPPGLPESLLQPSANAGLDLARRYSRTHGPFTTDEFARRYGLGRATAEVLLKELAVGGRLLEGEFRPGGTGREWCDAEVLQSIRRRSLAKLRKEVEPVDPPILGRLITSWQGVVRRRLGLDALLDTIENLQGAPLPASIFESEILAARIEGYNPADLDALTAGGEIVWCGVEPLGERDGRIALYLTDHFARLRREQPPADLSPRAQQIVAHLTANGASFFADLHQAAGGGYPGETVDTLWDLVWKGVITNDTFHALRAFTRPPQRQRRRGGNVPVRHFRSRRLAPPSAEGRWSLVSSRVTTAVSPTEWSTATAQQLLARYGVVTRDVAAAEGITGGFSAVYDVLKALEDAGRIRRGYFVGGVGATQFALPAALDLLRSLRELPEEAEVVCAGGDRSRESLRHDPAMARRRRRERRRPPHDAQRRLARHPRQRRARRVYQPGRPSAAGVPARRRTGAIDGRPRALPGGWLRWRETAACSSPK